MNSNRKAYPGWVALLVMLCLASPAAAQQWQDVETPHNFLVELTGDIPSADAVRTLEVAPLPLDAAVLTEVLLGGDAVFQEHTAHGPRYLTSDGQRYLYVYDGGEGAGQPNGMLGGLIFGRLRDGIVWGVKGGCVFDNDPGVHPDAPSYRRRADYVQTDLPFMRRADAEADVQALLRRIGVDSLVVSERYALDAATMQAHYRDYLAQTGDQPQWSFDARDEAYVFLLRQRLEGLTVIDYEWASARLGRRGLTPTSVCVTVAAQGVTEFIADGLYTVLSADEPRQPIGGAQALGKVAAHYGRVAIPFPVRVVDGELCYVVTLGRGGLLARPAWVFSIWREAANQDEPGTLERVAVDALAGERIRGL